MLLFMSRGCTCCYQLVTVLININASGVQIYYCAPGLKLSRVSHYTALGQF